LAAWIEGKAGPEGAVKRVEFPVERAVCADGGGKQE
jgi:hypothetical protein